MEHNLLPLPPLQELWFLHCRCSQIGYLQSLGITVVFSLCHHKYCHCGLIYLVIRFRECTMYLLYTHAVKTSWMSLQFTDSKKQWDMLLTTFYSVQHAKPSQPLAGASMQHRVGCISWDVLHALLDGSFAHNILLLVFITPRHDSCTVTTLAITMNEQVPSIMKTQVLCCKKRRRK